MLFYLFILLIIIVLFLPDGRENFVVKTIKENVLTKTEDLSKYIILNQ
jgi:hypothetical protein